MIKTIVGSVCIGVSLFLHFVMCGDDPCVPQWFISRMQQISLLFLIAGLAIYFI